MDPQGEFAGGGGRGGSGVGGSRSEVGESGGEVAGCRVDGEDKARG